MENTLYPGQPNPALSFPAYLLADVELASQSRRAQTDVPSRAILRNGLFLVNLHPLVHIQTEGSIGIDMLIKERR